MSKKKAYKHVVALAVLSAMSTTGVWAATTPAAASANDQAVAQKNAEMAAIKAARAGAVPAAFEAEQAVKEQRAKKLDNSSLATKDAEVLQVTKVSGDKLQEKQAEGYGEVAEAAQARYVSGLTDSALAPYLGKVITSVGIEGATPAEEAQLKAYLTEKIGDKVTEAGIKADIEALGNTGVFSEVNPVFTVVPEGVKLSFRLTSNPIVKRVEFEGNTVYPSSELINYMHITPGTVLNTVAVGERIEGINAAYQRDGYILAQVKDMKVLPDGTLLISIYEGKVTNITVHGNEKTKPYVITREMLQKVGNPFNKFLVRRSIERVYNLGFFDDVNVRLIPDTDGQGVTVEVDVLEHKTGTITLGAGYSDSDGMVGVIEVGEDNLRGTGDKVKVHWEFGGSAGYRNYSISYLRPWIDKKATSLGVNVFNNKYLYTDYNENGQQVAQYDKLSKGFNISLGRQTGLYSRDYITLENRNDRYDRSKKDGSGYNYNLNQGYLTNVQNGILDNAPTDEETKAAQAAGLTYNKVPPQEGDKYVLTNPRLQFQDNDYLGKNFGVTHSVTWSKVYDSRDNVYNPTRGKRVSFSGQWAGHGLGGHFNFYKLTAEYRTYKNLGHNHVLALRGRVGWGIGHLPYSQLYTLGGADSLRGYEDDQFRGQKMYAGTLEYRFPIWNKVSGVVFTDIGDAWDTPNVSWYNSKKQINYSVGAGMRLITPIGPIRLDYGIGRHNHKKFHFSFGGQF